MMLRQCILCGWAGADEKLVRHGLFGGWIDPGCKGHCPDCWRFQVGHCSADRLGVPWSRTYSDLDFEVALA